MNKALYALVCVILVLAGYGLFLEYNLFQKRSLLSDRNKQLEDAVVSLANTIEEKTPASGSLDTEIRLDNSSCDAKDLTSTEINWESVLDAKYDTRFEFIPPAREKGVFINLNAPGDDGKERVLQLRNHLALDGNGQPVPDEVNPGKFKTSGQGTAAELIEYLVSKATDQHELLNETRAELTRMRERIPPIVEAHNSLKKQLRREKINVEEQKAIVAQLEEDKTALEGRVAKLEGEKADLNTEITALRDEVQAKSDEVEAAREEVEQHIAKEEQLTKMIVELQTAARGAQTTTQGSTSAATFTYGDKGAIAAVDNEIFTAALKLSNEALDELMGPERNKPLPLLELSVKRAGADGTPELIGKVRLRQYVKGRDYVIADVLEDWQQMDFRIGDIVFAE